MRIAECGLWIRRADFRLREAIGERMTERGADYGLTARAANPQSAILNPQSDQKSKLTPILKNRDCSTLVGRSHCEVAVFENVLVTVNGQLLLKML